MEIQSDNIQKHHVDSVITASRYPAELSYDQIKSTPAQNPLSDKKREKLTNFVNNLTNTLMLQPHATHMTDTVVDTLIRTHEALSSPLATFMTDHYLHTLNTLCIGLEGSLNNKTSNLSDIQKDINKMIQPGYIHPETTLDKPTATQVGIASRGL